MARTKKDAESMLLDACVTAFRKHPCSPAGYERIMGYLRGRFIQSPDKTELVLHPRKEADL